MYVIKMTKPTGAEFWLNPVQQWSKERAKAWNFPTAHTATLRMNTLTAHLSADEKKGFSVEPLKII